MIVGKLKIFEMPNEAAYRKAKEQTWGDCFTRETQDGRYLIKPSAIVDIGIIKHLGGVDVTKTEKNES